MIYVLGSQAQSYLERAQPVPDEILVALLAARLKSSLNCLTHLTPGLLTRLTPRLPRVSPRLAL